MKIKIFDYYIQMNFEKNEINAFLNKYLPVLDIKIDNGEIYYLVNSDNIKKYINILGVEDTIYELSKERKKEVVIFKEFYKLSPYWIVEFFKRKGEKIYCYEKIKENKEQIFKLVKNIDDKQYKNFSHPFHNLIYTKKYLSEIIHNNSIIDKINKHTIYKNREDPILISLVKDINDEKVAKIIEIPKNVAYFIELGQGNGEYIQEYGRRWH